MRYWARLGSDSCIVSDEPPKDTYAGEWIEMKTNRPFELLYKGVSGMDVYKRYLPTPSGDWEYSKQLTDIGIWEIRNSYMSTYQTSAFSDKFREKVINAKQSLSELCKNLEDTCRDNLTDQNNYVSNNCNFDLTNYEYSSKYPFTDQLKM